MCNSVLSKICLLLAIVGGLNWGFVGIWKLDIIAWLLGGQTSWAASMFTKTVNRTVK